MPKLADIWVNVSDRGVKKTQAKIQTADKTTSKWSKSIGMLKLALIGIGSAVVLNAIKNVINVFKDYGLQIDKFTKQTGISTEAIQKLVYASEQEHSSLEALNKGLMNLTVRLGYAGDGLETYLRYFRALGIEYKNVDGTLRDTHDVFLDISDAVSQGEMSTEKLSATLQLFGARSGKELIPLLKKGRDWFELMGDEAKELGIVLESKVIKQTKEFDDQLTKLKGAFRGIQYAIGTLFLPILNDLVEVAIEVIGALKDWDWLLPSITEAITGQVREVDKLEQAYSDLDDELQEIIEREGKYSIEVFAKLLELDEKLRLANIEVAEGTKNLADVMGEVNKELKDAGFLTPLFMTAEQDLIQNALTPAEQIIKAMAKFQKDLNDETERGTGLTKEKLEFDKNLYEMELLRNELAWDILKAEGQKNELMPLLTEQDIARYEIEKELQELRQKYLDEQHEKEMDAWRGIGSAISGLNMELTTNIDTWTAWGRETIRQLTAVIFKLLVMAGVIKGLEKIGVPAGELLKLGGSLGLYQTPSGDAMAYREGSDFGKFFFSGFKRHMGAMPMGIQQQQEPTILKIYADTGIIVEKMSEMSLTQKSKFYRDVTKEAQTLET